MDKTYMEDFPMFSTEKLVRLLLWSSIHTEKKIPEDYLFSPGKVVAYEDITRYTHTHIEIEDCVENLLRNNLLVKRVTDTLNLSTVTVLDRILQAVAYTDGRNIDSLVEEVYDAFALLNEILLYDKVRRRLSEDFNGCITALLALSSHDLMSDTVPCI